MAVRLRHFRREEVVYSGARPAQAFAIARDRVLRFRLYPKDLVAAHVPGDGRLTAGMDLVQRIKAGPLRMRGPVRVVQAWDDSDRAGFTYEAQPGHPEAGTATFEVTRDGDDVRFRIESDSGLRAWWVKLGAPMARALQRRAIRLAFAGMRTALAEA